MIRGLPSSLHTNVERWGPSDILDRKPQAETAEEEWIGSFWLLLRFQGRPRKPRMFIEFGAGLVAIDETTCLPRIPDDGYKRCGDQARAEARCPCTGSWSCRSSRAACNKAA